MTGPQPVESQNSPVRDRVSADEWQARCDLAACYRICAHLGWDELIFTHLSLRVPGAAGHFLINPFGLMFSEITASSLVKVDLEGTVVLDNGHVINPAGFVIHGAVHAARTDAHAVLHVHTVAGVGVSCQPGGLLPISQNALVLLDDLACHDYEGIALELEERARLIADIGARNLVILRNHGLMTLGGTVAEAFIRLYFLQRACEMQLAAQAGGAVITLPDDLVRRVGEQGRFGFGGALADTVWAAQRRLQDARDPSYNS